MFGICSFTGNDRRPRGSSLIPNSLLTLLNTASAGGTTVQVSDDQSQSPMLTVIDEAANLANLAALLALDPYGSEATDTDDDLYELEYSQTSMVDFEYYSSELDEDDDGAEDDADVEAAARTVPVVERASGLAANVTVTDDDLTDSDEDLTDTEYDTFTSDSDGDDDRSTL